MLRNVALGLIVLLGSGRAWAQAEPAPTEAPDPKLLLKPKVRSAGQVPALDGNAKAYAEAKRALGRGQPAAALKALKGSSGRLLADREALLKGDALLALGDKAGAKAAYEQALLESQLPSVSIAAARGLITVFGQLKDRATQLAYVEALLLEPGVPKRAHLLLQKAEILRALGRGNEAAETAWRVLLDFPTASVAKSANQLLLELQKGGVKIPATSEKLELARIRNLIQASAYSEAEKAIAALEKKNPKLSRALDQRRAELFQRQRLRKDEQALLLKLYQSGLEPEEGPEVLFRLGQLAMAQDDDANAIKWFDELKAKYPKKKQTKEAQYLAGWIPYNKGEFAEATRRMLTFASDFPKAKQRSEALWFAGWSAYLGQDRGVAKRAWQQLIEEHPQSELVANARYWTGRIHQQAGEIDLAKNELREVLKTQPLSYYGFWSMARLEELGETTVLDAPPPVPGPATMRQALEVLGPDRPIGVDRAIALHQAKLTAEAQEELTAVESFLRGVKNFEGRTVVADMLSQLGAHYLAFRIGAAITADGGDLASGQPHAWRAWRHAYPRAYAPAVEEAGKTHQIDEDLVLSIMRTESHFRPWVKSGAGARGLMQLMPATAKQIGERAQNGRAHAARYQDPNSNVWLGSWYLKSLVERYSGQMPAAVGAYNAGPGAMDRWLTDFGGMELDEFVERVPYRETRRYIRRVMETYLIYQRLNGKPLPKLITKIDRLPVPNGAVEF